MQNVLDQVWGHFHALVGAVGRNENAAFKDLFQEICVGVNPALVLEVGAHEATFSRRMGDLLPTTKIMAYEANPYVFERYRAQIPGRVAYLNQAVGVGTEPKTLYIPREIPTRNGPLTLSGANTTGSMHERTQSGVTSERVAVECTTIDEIVRIDPGLSPVVLWVDVEGAVGEVLFGAHRALEDKVAAILVEVETTAAWHGQWLATDVVSYLACRDFELLVRDHEVPWQYNCIFMKNSFVSDSVFALLRNYMTKLYSSYRSTASS